MISPWPQWAKNCPQGVLRTNYEGAVNGPPPNRPLTHHRALGFLLRRCGSSPIAATLKGDPQRLPFQRPFFYERHPGGPVLCVSFRVAPKPKQSKLKKAPSSPRVPFPVAVTDTEGRRATGPPRSYWLLSEGACTRHTGRRLLLVGRPVVRVTLPFHGKRENISGPEDFYSVSVPPQHINRRLLSSSSS
jgi:hypothetical protein